MSIAKQHTSYPDTLRTLASDINVFHQFEGIFVTPESFTFTDAQFASVDYWYSQLGINIFPLHGVSEMTPQDDETSYKKSQQDFTLKTNNGKYRHKIKYNFSLDYHQLITEISTEKLNIIYYSENYLRAVRTSTDVIRGFKASAFEVEKMLFTLNNSIGDTDILIELLDSNELNVYGYELEVDWSPAEVDRLVLNISLAYSANSITMQVRYLNENIEGIQASDITLNDNTYGNITFSTFVPGDGIYLMSNFYSGVTSVTPTNGCLSIQSTIYIGQKKYRFAASVTVSNYWLLFSGDYLTTFSGDRLIWFN